MVCSYYATHSILWHYHIPPPIEVLDHHGTSVSQSIDLYTGFMSVNRLMTSQTLHVYVTTIANFYHTHNYVHDHYVYIYRNLLTFIPESAYI